MSQISMTLCIKYKLSDGLNQAMDSLKDYGAHVKCTKIIYWCKLFHKKSLIHSQFFVTTVYSVDTLYSIEKFV